MAVLFGSMTTVSWVLPIIRFLDVGEKRSLKISVLWHNISANRPSVKRIKCQKLAIIASDDAPAPTTLLAFTRVDLAKRRSEMTKSNTSKANLPLISTETGQKTTGDFTTVDATLDQFSRLNSDLEDNFEPSMLNNEGGDVETAPVAVSQPGGVSDLTDVDWILNDWIKYEQRALNFAPLTKLQLQAIRLLTILRNSKASLGTYDDIMNWHFRENGAVYMHKTASSRHFFSRSKLFSFLKALYKRDVGYGFVNEIILPSHKSRVPMVTNDMVKSYRIC